MAGEHTPQAPRKSCISKEQFQQLVPGDLITYLLAPHLQPTNPLREWHGRIEYIYPGTELVRVVLLDEGYIGLIEDVRRTEIIEFTKKDHEPSREDGAA